MISEGSKAIARAPCVFAPSRQLSTTMKAAETPSAKALPSYILNCPETQVTTLPNGLRVASEVGFTPRCAARCLDHSVCWFDTKRNVEGDHEGRVKARSARGPFMSKEKLNFKTSRSQEIV